jgi:glutamate-1-semialdehyde 2,1-aminomutase
LPGQCPAAAIGVKLEPVMASHRASSPPVDPLPGGAGRSGLVVGGRVAPRAYRGVGYRVLDEQGRWLIDANNNFTTLVHGHGHRGMTEAVTEVLADGITSVGLSNRYESGLAATLVDRLASVDQVRFTNSGSEAIHTAVRLARATTGRSAVIGVAGAYHGSSGPALAIHGGSHLSGVPDGESRIVLRVARDDVATLEAAVAACGDDLALILVDLVANYTGLNQLDPAFVAAARRLCDERGALLAIDEVVSLRHAVGGMQSLYDVRPDLTVMGKIIGGGFPVGAVGGSRDALALLDPTAPGSLHSSGTFSGNPVSMAAGLACLADLDEGAIVRLTTLGALLRERLEAAVPEDWEVRGFGSLARLFAPGGQPTPPEFFWRAYERGVLVTPQGLIALSTPMDEAAVDAIAAALTTAAHEVTDGT